MREIWLVRIFDIYEDHRDDQIAYGDKESCEQHVKMNKIPKSMYIIEPLQFVEKWD